MSPDGRGQAAKHSAVPTAGPLPCFYRNKSRRPGFGAAALCFMRV